MSEFANPVSRRGVLAGGVMVAGGAALAGCAKAEKSIAAEDSDSTGSTGPTGAEETMGSDIVAFDGEHQAGIQTPVQAHVELVGFNLKKGTTARGARALMLSLIHI